MSPSKWERARRKIGRMRLRRGLKARDLETLAKAIGLRKMPRGKEPTWGDPEAAAEIIPVAIPNHPGEMGRFTARSILDGLEAALETKAAKAGEEDGGEHD